jgi:hypothetical protein
MIALYCVQLSGMVSAARTARVCADIVADTSKDIKPEHNHLSKFNENLRLLSLDYSGGFSRCAYALSVADAAVYKLGEHPTHLDFFHWRLQFHPTPARVKCCSAERDGRN